MSDTPKFLSKQELELQEVNYIFSLRAERDELQEQLNNLKAALIVIRADIEEHNQIYDLSTDTALLLEGIDGIAFDALAAIGNEGSGDE